MRILSSFTSEDCRLVSRDTVWQGRFSLDRLVLEHARFGTGELARVERLVFERGDAVGVLPYDPQSDTVVLVEQLRAGAVREGESPWLLELVAGIIEPGESEETVARREADEEAAARLGELVPVAAVYPSPGACSERVQVYCAHLLGAGEGDGYGVESESEDIRVHRLARSDAMAALNAGWVTSSLTVIALQWLALNLDHLRRRWSPAGREPTRPLAPRSKPTPTGRD